MATCTYQQILHSVALRANALVGSQTAPLETTYATSPLTSANFESADFPFTSFRDAILQAEADFVLAVALTGQHPWRGFIRGVTVPLTSPSVLPFVDSNATRIVGVWGAVYDNFDGNHLTEMPVDTILRRVRNANSHYVIPAYYYKIDGNRIIHTRTSVVVECCVYSRADQVTSYTANGNILLPDPAESGIVARALSFLFRDGVYAEQAAVWRRYSDDALMMIRSGIDTIIPRSVPVPVTQTRAN